VKQVGFKAQKTNPQTKKHFVSTTIFCQSHLFHKMSAVKIQAQIFSEKIEIFLVKTTCFVFSLQV